MKKLLTLAAALLVVAASTPAHAQDRSAEIDRVFGWATPGTPGCAVAVSQHGEVVAQRAYGLADLERDVPMRTDTVFDIGSVQKQFVAAAVLLLVEEGRVSLSEDIRAYIPELPATGHRVTLDHLLTHTSGVRDWTAILPLAVASSDALTIALRQRGLNFPPGEEWAYSNTGYVLLKEIVGRASGVSFGEFARQRLFEPLGMGLTHYQYDWREVVKNRALAYEQRDGRWRADMLLDDERGGGGALLSTAGDLLTWNEALASGLLGAFVTEKLQEPARLNNGRALGYARGLYLDTAEELVGYRGGGNAVWHSGSANAYNSLLARFPEQGLSIAILCNAGDMASPGQFARRIFDQLVPAVGPTGPVPGGAAGSAPAGVVEGLDLSGRAGLFFGERTGEPLRLAVESGRLRFVGGPALVPVSGDTFRAAGASLGFMSEDRPEVRFVSPDLVEVKTMEGTTTVYRRAQSHTPGRVELEALAGRYESDEIGAVFQVVVNGEGLTVRPAHLLAVALEMQPVARDVFQGGNHFVRFIRDGAGRVVAFGYSNPLLRDVRFTRLGEGPR